MEKLSHHRKDSHEREKNVAAILGAITDVHVQLEYCKQSFDNLSDQELKAIIEAQPLDDRSKSTRDDLRALYENVRFNVRSLEGQLKVVLTHSFPTSTVSTPSRQHRNICTIMEQTYAHTKKQYNRVHDLQLHFEKLSTKHRRSINTELAQAKPSQVQSTIQKILERKEATEQRIQLYFENEASKVVIPRQVFARKESRKILALTTTPKSIPRSNSRLCAATNAAFQSQLMSATTYSVTSPAPPPSKFSTPSSHPALSFKSTPTRAGAALFPAKNSKAAATSLGDGNIRSSVKEDEAVKENSPLISKTLTPPPPKTLPSSDSFGGMLNKDNNVKQFDFGAAKMEVPPKTTSGIFSTASLSNGMDNKHKNNDSDDSDGDLPAKKKSSPTLSLQKTLFNSTTVVATKKSSTTAADPVKDEDVASTAFSSFSLDGFGKSFNTSSPKGNTAPTPPPSSSSSKPPLFGGTAFASATLTSTFGTTGTTINYPEKLKEFYQKHNPEKLSQVDSTLQKYIGKEVDLFKKLFDKYKLPLTSLDDFLTSSSAAAAAPSTPSSSSSKIASSPSPFGATTLGFSSPSSFGQGISNTNTTPAKNLFGSSSISTSSSTSTMGFSSTPVKSTVANATPSSPFGVAKVGGTGAFGGAGGFGGAGAFGTPQATTITTDYRTRLTEFYSKHNPTKMNDIESTLMKYKGREEEMFKKLEEKYNKNPMTSSFGGGSHNSSSSSSSPSPFGQQQPGFGSTTSSLGTAGMSAQSSPFGQMTGYGPSSTPAFGSTSSFGTQQPQQQSPFGQQTTMPMSNNNYRERLIQFYQQHNPSKLADIDKTLAKYQGREEKLFHDLEMKYKQQQQPLPASSSAFGAQPTATFGSTSSFGQQSQQSTGGFGSTSSVGSGFRQQSQAPAFGSSSSSTGFSSFASQSTGFGGVAATAPTMGGFGAASTFGSSNANPNQQTFSGMSFSQMR